MSGLQRQTSRKLDILDDNTDLELWTAHMN